MITQEQIDAAVRALYNLGATRAYTRWELHDEPDDQEFCKTGEDGEDDATDDVA